MPKINLLKRKKMQIQRKHAESGAVYLITTEQNDRPYYVAKVVPETKSVIWTPIRDKAMMFHTEPGTQQFIRIHLKHRPNVHLIQTMSKHA